MNSLTHILPGIFACVLSSWMGLVAIPYFQLGTLQPKVNEDLGQIYPVDAPKAGKQVYIENGCINCHSQQVRPGHAGGDIGRGWGPRQTVARDYMYEQPLLTGTIRLGPDLANLGARIGDKNWLYRHLYNPRIDTKNSIMPAYPFLFEKVKISGEPSADALQLPESHAPEAGYQIIPNPEAESLVTYLLSLDRTEPVPEAIQETKEEEEKSETTEKKPETTEEAAPSEPGEQAAGSAPATDAK